MAVARIFEVRITGVDLSKILWENLNIGGAEK